MKAVIFDCFGVLVGKGFWRIYESLGGDLAADQNFIDEQLARVDLGEISGHEFSEIMARRINVDLDTYLEAFKIDEHPNEDIFEFIKNELKPNYKLALVSNATGDSVRSKIPVEKLALFDAVLISGEVGVLKPDRRIFEMALTQLNIKAKDAVFVDDHQEYIDGAKLVGLRTILYTNLESFKQELATNFN